MSKILFASPEWDNDLPSKSFNFGKKSKQKRKNKGKFKCNLPATAASMSEDNETGKFVRIKKNRAIGLTDGSTLSGKKRKIKQHNNIEHKKSAVSFPLTKQRKTLNHTVKTLLEKPGNLCDSRELKLKKKFSARIPSLPISNSQTPRTTTTTTNTTTVSIADDSSVALLSPQMFSSNTKMKRGKRKNAIVGNEINFQVKVPKQQRLSSPPLPPMSLSTQQSRHQKQQQKEKSQPTNRTTSMSFREKLIDNLKGSRFRYLNEMLYTTDGRKAQHIFHDDPEAFAAYHDGFRQQVKQWPLNPLSKIIKSIKKLPMDYIIADFGCGDGQLAKSIIQKTYSLDLVATNPDIIACDMASTPLEDDSINVVVFCLSLMGINLNDFILEANRVMKVGGILKIAEVESRFANIKQFIENVEKCGFQLINKDLSNNLFYFLNFKKVKNVSKQNNFIPNLTLKPCLYKKR